MDNDIKESVKIEASDSQKKTENVTVEVSEIIDKTHILHITSKIETIVCLLENNK